MGVPARARFTIANFRAPLCNALCQACRLFQYTNSSAWRQGPRSEGSFRKEAVFSDCSCPERCRYVSTSRFPSFGSWLILGHCTMRSIPLLAVWQRSGDTSAYFVRLMQVSQIPLYGPCVQPPQPIITDDRITIRQLFPTGSSNHLQDIITGSVSFPQ